MDNQWGQLIGAIVVFLAILGTYIQSRSNAQVLTKQTDKIDEVHVLVNSHLTAVVTDVIALAKWITTNAKPGDPPAPVLMSAPTPDPNVVVQPEVPKDNNV